MKNVCFKLALGFVSVAASLIAINRYCKREEERNARRMAALDPYKGNPPTEDELIAAGVVDLGVAVEQAVKDTIEKSGKPVKTIVVVVDKADDEDAEKTEVAGAAK